MNGNQKGGEGSPGPPSAHINRRPAPIYTQGFFRNRKGVKMGRKKAVPKPATRLEKLKFLEASLLVALAAADTKSYASIAKQYRETIKEIEELEGTGNAESEIDKILNS